MLDYVAFYELSELYNFSCDFEIHIILRNNRRNCRGKSDNVGAIFLVIFKLIIL